MAAITREQEKRFQETLEKKQKFLSKTIENIQSENIDAAIRTLDIEIGLNMELVKILGGKI